MSHGFEPGCTCSNCKRAGKQRLRELNSERPSAKPGRSKSLGWTPRSYGTLSSGEEVTFKEGINHQDGETLIADGTVSGRAFNKKHNHYGDNDENDERIEDSGGDRGHYTGPGH